MNKMNYRFLQCMIVLGLAAFLTEKWISGRLSFYINLRFTVFTLLGIVGLMIMEVIGLIPIFTEKQESKKQNIDFIIVFLSPVITAALGLSVQIVFTIYVLVGIIGFVRLKKFQEIGYFVNNQSSKISGKALILLTIPLILGVAVPARPLSTLSLNTRGMSLSAPVSIGQQSVKTLEITPDDRTILDWIRIFNDEKASTPYMGETANVVGFVYHDPRLKADQFMVGRFTITCCVADAFAIGMAVNWPDSSELEDNSWVNVRGTVDELEINGQKVPVVQAQAVNPVQAPEQPYLYP